MLTQHKEKETKNINVFPVYTNVHGCEGINGIVYFSKNTPDQIVALEKNQFFSRKEIKCYGGP